MKSCISCKSNYDISFYNKKGLYANGETRYTSKCKSCLKSYRKKHYDKNSKKIISKVAQYKKTDAGVKMLKKSWQKYYKNASINITDIYVKHLISKRTKLSYNEVPLELIETKRILLQLKRELNK